MKTEPTDIVEFSPERLLSFSKRIALPRWFYDRNAEAFDVAGLKFRPTRINFAMYVIPVMLLERSSPEALLSAAQSIRTIVEAGGTKAIIGIGMHMKLFETPIIVPEDGDVELRNHDPEDLFSDGPYQEAREVTRKVLLNFYRATGWGVRFHYGQIPYVGPHEAEPDLLHVHSNSAPAGSRVTRDMKRLFGYPLSGNLQTWGISVPSTGRGRFIKDAQDQSAALLIAHDLFVLYPVLTAYHGEDSQRLLHTIMAAAWKLLQEKPGRQRPKANAKTFAEAASKWTGRWTEIGERQVEAIQLKIEAAQRQLAEARREMILWNAVTEAVQQTSITNTTDRFPTEFRRIMRLPGVRAIEVDDEGFQWHTEPIVVAHAGRRYRIGPLTVRIGQDSDVTAWSEKPLHPDGIPHPHISEFATTCFGNVANAISKLLAAFRFADAVELIMRWLRDGYSAELARHKVEEWPLDEEATDGAQAELVDDEGAARSGSHPPDNADRERGCRVMDGATALEDGCPVADAV
jgi:hypothetical protein